jgi:hypothetical protein
MSLKTDENLNPTFSMNAFPFSDRSATEVETWFDVEKQSGHLANYLLDPQNFFEDGVTSRLTETLVSYLIAHISAFSNYL